MKNTALVIIKLVGAASIICLVALVFLVVSPDEKEALVKTADADIYMLDGSPDKNKYKNAVAALGIKARPYDFNGNIMFFGTARIHNSASAEETANLVQEELVHAGVNKRNYINHQTVLASTMARNLSPEQEIENSESRKAMLAGELVPTRKTKNVYEMSGVLGLGSTADAFIEKTARMSENEIKGKRVSDLFNGYRYLEVRQDEGSRTAEILTVWTDDDFDAGKLTNEEGVQQSPPDEKIPACVGCKRVRRVAALDKTEPYNINKWNTTSNMDETYDFYLKAMTNRGWKESGKQRVLNKMAELIPNVARLRGRGLSLEKDGEVIEITILPRSTGGGAQVFSMEQYMDTQPTLDKLPKPPGGISGAIDKVFSD